MNLKVFLMLSLWVPLPAPGPPRMKTTVAFLACINKRYIEVNLKVNKVVKIVLFVNKIYQKWILDIKKLD